MEATKCTRCGQEAAADVKSVVSRFAHDRGNLIPLLHAVQDAAGILTEESMKEIAEWLGIPFSEVYGTATFYTLFATEPKGKYVVRFCDSPPCHIEGAQVIKRAIEDFIGAKVGETSKDGLFTFEEVSCVGLCGVAPALMVNDDVYGNLTPDAIPDILGNYRKEGE